MRIRLRYFAGLRERRGRTDEQIDVAPGTTAGALYRALFPPGPEGALPVLYAINQSYATADTALEDGDELVFVPPLGGG